MHFNANPYTTRHSLGCCETSKTRAFQVGPSAGHAGFHCHIVQAFSST